MNSSHHAARVSCLRPLVPLFLLCTASGYADVALIREMSDANVYAVPAIVADKQPPPQIAMRSAEVRIHLRRPGPNDAAPMSDCLVAEIRASFDLFDQSPPADKARDFLVGFPLTGLSAATVAPGKFSVTVDGVQPATVRRKFEVRRTLFSPSGFFDTPVSGQLEARFGPKAFGGRGITMTDRSVYSEAFVWHQSSKPGATTRVVVDYTVTLLPMPMRHRYPSQRDQESVPESVLFALMKAAHEDKDPRGHYYIFDYVLRSGATWAGGIGQESITLTAAPELQLALDRVTSFPRYPEKGAPKAEETLKTDRAAATPQRAAEGLRWDVKGTPAYDLLVAIPGSAFGPAQTAK